MMDHYVSGKVDRISPEAPVPVVKVEREWSTLGGAGNVASNAASLGAETVLVGKLGNDNQANEVQNSCENLGIKTAFVKGNQPTIVKTRVVSGQQIVRFDKEEFIEWTDAEFNSIKSILSTQIKACDIVLLSDYAKGTLSNAVLEEVFTLAKKENKRVLVDPKRADWSSYSGAFLVTPNLLELGMTAAGNGVKNDDNQIVDACNKLRNQFRIENIVATRSSYGMSVVSKNSVLNIPTRALEVYDVSGAGDTVLATLGVSLAQGKTVSESAFLANAAAGIVVSKLGTAVVKQSELSSFVSQGSKLIEKGAISAFKQTVSNQKVVFTNGCFDVLHQGHRQLLKEAQALGDKLIVGLNSDDSIRRLKGSQRPINKLNQRVEALSALPFVDGIIVFEEDTPFELIKALQPNTLVKGGDYSKQQVVGNDLVKNVVILPLLKGISTTELMG